MAQVDTLNNPNDPTNPNAPGGAAQAPQGQVNQPATTGGAGSVTATGAGNVTGQVVGTATPSQPFQNISSYLAANDPQSQQLATQVAGTVSQPITQAQNDITSAANTFTGQVGAGYAPKNQDLINAVASNPAFVVGENPENTGNFLAQLNNAYTGPSDFTQSPGYSNLETEIANAQGQAKATQTPQGIQTLLNSVEGPTTAGINKLDSLLLTNKPENISTIQSAGASAAALPGTLTNTTAAQNALAAQGSTAASDTKTAAAKALQDALGSEKKNLSGQQSTIEGIVNEYNKSVGVINPVTQSIAAFIQNYLAANPNLKLNNATDVLSPLENLQNLSMPDISTYASPYDYQTVAALGKLGLDPATLAGLPINGSTQDKAQTFHIPTALQDAIGQAPGVESALNTELTGLGNQISTAYQPFQDLVTKEGTRADFRSQMDKITQPLDVLQNRQTSGYRLTPEELQQITDLKAQQSDLMTKANAAGVGGDLYGSYKGSLGQMGQDLQWLSPASTGYNDLITAINSELGKLGSVGVPTLNYAPTTLTDPVAGAPIGKVATKDIGKAADLAAVGAGGAAGIGSGILAGTEAAGAPLASGYGLGDSALIGYQAGMETLGPATLAAYGASNIAQNSIAHPIESGLATLANMGLSLATLSLPPKYFESIGKGISNVINSIGSFFGNLF